MKFIGLPSRVHRPPLEFQASKDQLVGMVTYDPDEECQAKHDLVLDKPKPSPRPVVTSGQHITACPDRPVRSAY